MKIISVVNYKGGVGKTTLLANVAVKLARDGKRILLIDLDPQGSLTFSFMHTEEWLKKYEDTRTIKNWFNNKLNKKKTKIEDYITEDLLINKKHLLKGTISLIPSHFELFDISLELALKLRGTTKRDINRNTIEHLFMLKKGIDEIKTKYDFILIDCQPSFDLLTQNAIVSSDYYFIPTKLDSLSTMGIESMLSHIDKLVNGINEKTKKFTFNNYKLEPKLLGVAANMVNIYKNNNKTTFNEGIEKRFSGEKYRLFKNSIRNNSEFMDMEGLIPAILKKADNNTKKNIVHELEELASEFEERING